MSNQTSRVRGAGRRTATFAGVVGMLMFSVGLSLAVQSGSNAAPGGHIAVLVCHATGSDSNPYVTIYPDASSTDVKGHQAHRDHPNKTWKSDGWFNGVHHLAGGPKRDYIHSFTDGNGVFHQEDGNIAPGFCSAPVTKYLTVSASVSYTEPSCTQEAGTWTGTQTTNVSYAVKSGTTAAGDTIIITATAAPFYTFSADPNVAQATTDLPAHTFATVNKSSCGPEPTTVDTINPAFADPTCGDLTRATIDFGNGPMTGAQLSAANNTVTIGGVVYTVSGSVAPNGSVTITAVAANPQTHPIAEGDTVSWPHTFQVPSTPCVQPPQQVPTIAPAFADPTCNKDGVPAKPATVNLAGLGALTAGELAATNNKIGFNGITYTVTGTVSSGHHVQVTATEVDPAVAEIATGQTTVWTHTYPARSANPCGKPQVVTPGPTPVIPTAVHSGLDSIVQTAGNTGSPARVLGLGLAALGSVLMLGSMGLIRRTVKR